MSRLTPSTHPTRPPIKTSSLPSASATYFPLHMLMLQAHSVGGFVNRKGGGKKAACIRGQLYAFHQIDSSVAAGLFLDLHSLSLSLPLFFPNVPDPRLVAGWRAEGRLVCFYILAAKRGGFLYQQVADRFNALGRARSQWAHYRSSSGDLLVLLLFGFMVPMKMGGLA